MYLSLAYLTLHETYKLSHLCLSWVSQFQNILKFPCLRRLRRTMLSPWSKVEPLGHSSLNDIGVPPYTDNGFFRGLKHLPFAAED